MNVVAYKKTFNDFHEGIEELTKLVPMVKDYVYGSKDITDNKLEEKDVISNLLDMVKTNPPCISNPNYPYTYSIETGAFNTSFKTDKRLSFGWKTVADFKNKTIAYTFRASFPSAKDKSKAEFDLLEGGWTPHDYTNNSKKK